MNEGFPSVDPAESPVSSFKGPIGELIAQRMLAPPPRPGLLAVLDQFEILRVLGGGGMGIVLLARDANTGRDVAMKLIRTELVNNQEVVHRFLREAGHLKRLRHTNIMPVLEISDREESPYFTMPYFEKGSLASRIHAEQFLDTETILDIATQVAEGLSFAHRNGIIHRDLKPANILLAADGQATLADFGLARTLFNDTIINVGARNWEGTAPYMSPAVAAGDAEDTRCDIYSFGALLYEMLTGQPPYTGRSSREILDRIIAGPPAAIATLNPQADRRLVAVTEGCLARELQDRYADMRYVLKDLRQIKDKHGPAGPRTFGGETLGRFEKNQLPKAVWLAMGLAGFVCLGWVFWHRSHEMFRPPEPPPYVVKEKSNEIKPVKADAVKPIVSAGNLRTLAGRVGSKGHTDGSANDARFSLPNNLVLDGTGNVYVADTANNVIRKISTQGTVTTFAGVAGSYGSVDGLGTQARFWAPNGLAMDREGNMYVADTLNNTIRKINPDGVVSTLAGLAGVPGGQDGTGASARFRNPHGIAVSGTGAILVADTSNNTIRKITPAGVVTTLAGRAGMSGSLSGMGPEARFNNPYALAVDRFENIYIADSFNHLIWKLSPNGLVSSLAGVSGHPGVADGGSANAQFNSPRGLAADDRGNLYVADTGNNSIREITAAGLVKTLEGKETAGANAATGSVTFASPGGVAVDKAGNLYIADSQNHVIRIITASALLSP